MNVMQGVYDAYMQSFNCSSLSCLRQVDASKLMRLGNIKGIERAGSNVSGFTTVEWAPVRKKCWEVMVFLLKIKIHSQGG